MNQASNGFRKGRRSIVANWSFCTRSRAPLAESAKRHRRDRQLASAWPEGTALVRGDGGE